MSFLYNKQVAAFIAAIAIASSACGQHSKVKTITIVNGDTATSENEFDEKTLSQMEKEMNISIHTDDKGEKKIVKKIIIKGEGDDEKTAEAMAYAYSFGDGKGKDVEIITEGGNGDTKIIIKGDKEKTKINEPEEKKTVIRKTTEKSSLSLSISVKDMNAAIAVESGSKEPLNISILDENGRQVFYDTQKGGGKYSKEIPLGKKGTYFLNLIQDKKSTTEKIIIE